MLALGQDVDLSLLNGVPGLEIKNGVVQVGPNMMTGSPGIFAGGDMVPAERTVTVGVGHGKKAARHIDAWLRGGDYAPTAKARARDASTSSTPGTTRDAPKTVRPMLEMVAPPHDVRGSRQAGSTRPTRSSKRAAACPAATASSATTATACARTTPSSSSGRASASSSTTITARAAACARRNAPAVRSDGAGGDLDAS